MPKGRACSYKGVFLEDTKLKTEGTNKEKTQLQKPRKNTYTYKLNTTKQLGKTAYTS